MSTTIRVVAVLLLASSGCEQGKDDLGKSAETALAAVQPARRAEPRAQEVPVTTRSPEARAAFDRAQALLDNLRNAEAREQLKVAIDKDPDFAYAHALLGATTPGPEGTAEIEKARTLADNLPNAERLMVDLLRAQRDGDQARVGATLEKLVDAAPGDWRVRLFIGNREMFLTRYDDAIASFRKALEIAPETSEAYNGLAYANANLRRWDDAIDAARKQAVLRPDEPNPQDTYGEILLWANRFDEAEPAFRNALSISPAFAVAWQGVGLARAYQWDLAGAHQSFAEGRKAAKDVNDKLGFYVDDAWIALADGKPAEAAKSIAAFEKEAKAAKLPGYAEAPLIRGQIAYAQGKYPEARKQALQAIARGAKGDYSGGERKGIRRHAMELQIAAEARMNKPAEAAKTLSAFQDDVSAEPDRDAIEPVLAHLRGLVAWAKNGPKAGLEQLTACDIDDYWCAYHRMRAQINAGDTDAAKATAQQLRSRSYRAADFVWVRSQLPAEE